MHTAEQVLHVPIEGMSLESLRRLSKDFDCAPECVASLILDMLFEEAHDAGAQDGSKVRRALRKKTQVPCVLKFDKGASEITYTTAVIADISLGGVGIDIDEHRSRERLARDAVFFEVTVQPADESFPVSFNCRTCYVRRNNSLRVGAAFAAPEQVVLRKMLKVYLQPPPIAL